MILFSQHIYLNVNDPATRSPDWAPTLSSILHTVVFDACIASGHIVWHEWCGDVAWHEHAYLHTGGVDDQHCYFPKTILMIIWDQPRVQYSVLKLCPYAGRYVNLGGCQVNLILVGFSIYIYIYIYYIFCILFLSKAHVASQWHLGKHGWTCADSVAQGIFGVQDLVFSEKDSMQPTSFSPEICNMVKYIKYHFGFFWCEHVFGNCYKIFFLSFVVFANQVIPAQWWCTSGLQSVQWPLCVAVAFRNPRNMCTARWSWWDWWQDQTCCCMYVSCPCLLDDPIDSRNQSYLNEVWSIIALMCIYQNYMAYSFDISYWKFKGLTPYSTEIPNLPTQCHIQAAVGQMDLDDWESWQISDACLTTLNNQVL